MCPYVAFLFAENYRRYKCVTFTQCAPRFCPHMQVWAKHRPLAIMAVISGHQQESAGFSLFCSVKALQWQSKAWISASPVAGKHFVPHAVCGLWSHGGHQKGAAQRCRERRITNKRVIRCCSQTRLRPQVSLSDFYPRKLSLQPSILEVYCIVRWLWTARWKQSV